MIRIPDSIKNAVCFLAVKDRGHLRFGGTGFFVIHPDIVGSVEWATLYLVTARHCVEQALGKFGNLYARLNLKGGETRTVELRGPWIKSDQADLAIMPFEENLDLFESFIPSPSFLNDEIIQQHNFGAGDEIFITGLFTKRFGIGKNIPILRTGIVAAMPEEPIQGPRDPKPYNAYLLEVRSLGGLSGSPVFTIVHRGFLANRPARQFSSMVHHVSLVGIIRGHWDTVSGQDSELYNPVDGSVLNAGIALATPAQELLSLINSAEATAMRMKDIEEESKKSEGSPARP